MSWSGDRSTAFRKAVLALYGTTCHLCGGQGATTADHLIPRSRGGAPWDLANARPAHGSCNSARKDLDLRDWFRRNPLPTRPALPPSRQW